MAGMFYGTQVWDPVLITAQIVTMQLLFYMSYGLLLWILVGPYVPHLSLAHFFASSWMHFGSFVGWMALLANVCNALAVSAFLMFVVERAKKCLDFAATAYILHLVTVCIYSGFPKSGAWWVANLSAFVITAVLGEWLCLQREMRDIPIGSIAKKRSGTSTEMLPLNSIPTQPANGKTNSLFSRITASLGSKQSTSQLLPT